MKRISLLVLSRFASLKLALTCLVLLSVIVFWGTIYQVEYGLYLAQKDFYYAWLTPPISGWYLPATPNLMARVMSCLPFPLPGGLLILWFLSISLFCAMLLQLLSGWRKWGIVLIHIGLLLLLAGGWITHLYGQESFISLAEGDSTNLASSYQQWEISVSRGVELGREVLAVDADSLRRGDTVEFPSIGLNLIIEQYDRNSTPVLAPVEGQGYLNASGIRELSPQPLDKDSGKNIPGAICMLQIGPAVSDAFILFGNESRPLSVAVGQEEYFCQLRRRRIALPMMITLEDFDKEFHPNTDTPRKFSSRVRIGHQDLDRSVVIEMNRPFRQDGFTVYQSRHAKREDGTEISIFAVTKNRGRLVPYVATAITVLGLFVHFATRLIAGPKSFGRMIGQSTTA